MLGWEVGMGRTAFMVLSIFSTAVMLCSCGGSRQRSTSSDEDQIRAVLQQSIEAWNRGDVEAFAQTYCAEKRERRIDELKSMGPNDQRYGVGKITVNGDRAQAVITLPQEWPVPKAARPDRSTWFSITDSG